jgi:uncharacterized protein (TIGR02271 family)
VDADRKQNRTAETGGAALTVPVIGEEVHVDTRVVDTGGIRVSKDITERIETVDEPTIRHEAVIDRVPIDRILGPGELPSIREEGDTVIIPLFEEVLVVEKRVRLKEELRVTRVTREERSSERITLRTEQASVRRID